MAVREELVLDLSRALSAIDDLERELDSLLQPIQIPVQVDGDQAIDQLRRDIRAADTDDIDVDVDSTDLSRAENELEEMRREADRAERSIDDLGDEAQSAGREVQDLGRKGSASFGQLQANVGLLLSGVAAFAGAREFINFARDSIAAASDLEESLSKTNVVFGDFSSEIQAFAATAPSALGVSNQAALETTATFGNLFTALGLSQQAAADLSPEIVQLGSDLASFNNIEVDEALTALRSGLVGEVEPLRRLGVAINAAVVEAKALELGLVGANGEVTEAAKVQARYALILEQTSTAQGDFARTADGIANRQRTLAANFENLQASIGVALLPAYEDLLESTEDLVPALANLTPIIGVLVGQFADLVGPVGAVVEAFAALGEPITAIEEALGGLSGSDAPSFFDGVRDATLNTLNPLRQLDDILNEVNFLFAAGFATGTFNDALAEIESNLAGGVDSVTALEIAFDNLSERGTITASLLEDLARTAQVTDDELAGFLAEQLLTRDDLGTTEVEALRDALDDVLAQLGVVRGGGLDFARGRRGREEFIVNLEDINAALERVQFERATGQLEDLESAFANFDTSVLLEVEIPDISDQVAAIESDIGELPTALDAARAALRDEENEIVDDFGEFFGNLEAELAAQQQFAQNIQILRSLGFDDLADQFEALGIDSAGALADGLEDPAALARAEAALEAYGANIDQQFITRTAEAVAAATDSIDDLIAKINEVDGLSSTAQIQVFFEAIGAIDSRSVFESNIGTPTVPASAPSGSTTNVTNNFFTEPQPTTDTARINQAVSSVISPNVTQ